MRGTKRKKTYMGIIKRNRLSLDELEKYYRDRRAAKYEAGKPIRGIFFRKVIHVPIIGILKLYHHICPVKLRILYNNSEKKKRPTIYAATHVCWDDIEYAMDAITEQAYLFWGDPRELYRSFAGALLNLNGCIICDTQYKRDRFVAKETAIKLLDAGGNLLLFPEGVWNTSENKLVNYLFPGIAEMAIRTKVDIVPIAIERTEMGFDIAIGKSIESKSFDMEDKWMLLQEIRDAMATLKWDVLEASGLHRRIEIPPNYSAIFKNRFIEEARGISDWIAFEKQEFHPKDIIDHW